MNQKFSQKIIFFTVMPSFSSRLLMGMSGVLFLTTRKEEAGISRPSEQWRPKLFQEPRLRSPKLLPKWLVFLFLISKISAERERGRGGLDDVKSELLCSARSLCSSVAFLCPLHPSETEAIHIRHAPRRMHDDPQTQEEISLIY